MKTFQELDPNIKSNRFKLGLLRPHAWNVSPQKKEGLDTYLSKNPVMQTIHQAKQEINTLLLAKKSRVKDWKKLITRFLSLLEQLKECSFQPLKALGRALESWQEEIARMWRYSKNNGIAEGFHCKMKLIQRRACGFKNFHNYR